MHLADFSYTERCVQNVTVVVLFAVYLCSTTRRRDFSAPEKRWQTKNVVFYLIISSLLGWIIFDVLAMMLKYEEWRDPEAGCMPKAHGKYNQQNRDMLVGIKYYLNMVWTCHSSALFLLLVFLENLVKPYKISLATSREYTAYKIWAPLSFIVYPLVQTLFDYVFTGVRNHTLLGSVTPQLCNHLEVTFVSMMLFRANRKVAAIAYKASNAFEQSNRTLAVLRFQSACIHLLVFFLLLDVVGLATINLDVVMYTFLGGTGAIYKSAFASDLSITIFSVGLSGSHIAILLLLFPPSQLLEGAPRRSLIKGTTRAIRSAANRRSTSALNSDYRRSDSPRTPSLCTLATIHSRSTAMARGGGALPPIPNMCESSSLHIDVQQPAGEVENAATEAPPREHAATDGESTSSSSVDSVVLHIDDRASSSVQAPSPQKS